MEFSKPLVKGKLIKRYKRFFADIKINKEIVTAHCPNTGSMRGLLDEGNEVYLLPNNDPKRKLKYGLEIIKTRKNFVGVNTHIANKITHHALENNLIKELKDSDLIKPEVFFNKETRFDFLIEKNKQKSFLEGPWISSASAMWQMLRRCSRGTTELRFRPRSRLKR